MFHLLDAADVDQWTVQDGLYLRYNAAHGRFEGAPGGGGGGGISATGAVSLTPASTLDNVVTAQNAATTPITLKGAANQSVDLVIYADANDGSLVRITARGSLIASGSITVSGSLSVVQGADVWGGLSLRGALNAKDAATVSGSLTAAGSLQVWGGANLLNNLIVQGSTNLNGLTAGATTLNSLTVTGLVSLPNLLINNLLLSTLQVTGSTTLGGLTAGAATLNSAVVTGSLLVQGNSNLGGLTAGASTLSSLTVTGAVSLASLLIPNAFLASLQVTGATNLSSLVAGAAALNSATVTGNLVVQGSTNLNALVAGAGTLNSATVTGNLTTNGLFTAGASTVNSLTVTGGTTLSTLTVTGSGLVSGGITVSGSLMLGGPPPPSTLGDGQFGPNKPNLPYFYLSNRPTPSGTMVTNYHPGSSGSAFPRMLVWDDPLLLWFSANPVYHSGSFGLTLDKTDATVALPHAFSFAVSGDMKWGFGMDASTDTGGGNSDWVAIFDYKGRSGVGADMLRGCPSDSNAYGCNMWNWAAAGQGTPRSNSYFLTLLSYWTGGNLGCGLGGLNIQTSGGVGLLVQPQGGVAAAIFQGSVNTGGLTATTVTANSLVSTGSVTVNGSLVAGASTLNSVAVTGSLSVLGATNLGALTAGAATLNSLTVTGATVHQGAVNANGLVAGATTVNSLTVTGSLLVQGSTNLGGLTAGAGTLSSLIVTGSTTLNSLVAGAATLNSLTVTGSTVVNGGLAAGATAVSSLTVTGSLLVQSATNLGGLTAGASLLNSLTVTGAATINGSLVAGASTLNSVTVTGSAAIQGSSTILGSLSAGASTLNSAAVTGALQVNGAVTVLGGLTAGATTVNSLTVTGSAAMSQTPAAASASGVLNLGSGGFGGAVGNFWGSANGTILAINASGGYTGDLVNLQVSGATTLEIYNTGRVDISPVSLARCLTLNHAAGFTGATLFMTPASGTNRCIWRFGLFQIGTDSTFNGATDWWMQNLTTGRLVMQVLGTDQVNIGGQVGTGPVMIGYLSTSQVGFYGTTPASQPTAATDLLTGLVSQGLRASGTDVPLSLGGGTLTAGAGTLNSLTVTGSLTVKGGTNLGGLAAGASTLNSLTVTGSTVINGSLVAGAATLNSLTVTGSTLVNGALTAGAATLNALTVTGATALSGSLTLAGSLDVWAQASFRSKVGIGGTTNPQGTLAIQSQASTGFYETPQTFLCCSFLDALTDRAILLQQILNAGTANNYVMLRGAVSGTVASPNLTSVGGASFGVEGTDSTLSLLAAAQGAGLSPVRGLSMDSAGNLAAGALFQSPGVVLLGASTLSSATVTGNLLVQGATNLGGLVAGAALLNSLTATGTAQVNNSLTLLGGVSATGAASMTVVDNNSSIIPVLNLTHALTTPGSSGTSGMGVGINFLCNGANVGTSGGVQNFGSIQVFTNGTAGSYKTAMSFSTYFGSTVQELMRLRNQQLWIEGDLQHGGGSSGSGTNGASLLGFFGTTPIAQAANSTDLRTSLINYGLYTAGGATPLDLNGGLLTAASGTFNGPVTLGGHLNYTGTAPTATSGSAAGTANVPATVVASSSNDTRGNITFGSGTSPTSGAVLVVTFNKAYANTPVVDIIPRNTATASISPFIVSSVSTTGFTVSCTHPPVASQGNTVYNIDYMAKG